MKVYIFRVFYENLLRKDNTREFISWGETEEEAKGKVEHLLEFTGFVYNDLSNVEICAPFEIF